MILDAQYNRYRQETPGRQQRTRNPLSIDGSRVATASTDKTAKVWDTTSGELVGTCVGHAGEVSHVRFMPQGTKLLTTSDDTTARIWDAETCEMEEMLRSHTDIILTVDVNYSGNKIITASKDSTVKLWTAKESQLRHQQLSSA